MGQEVLEQRHFVSDMLAVSWFDHAWHLVGYRALCAISMVKRIIESGGVNEAFSPEKKLNEVVPAQVLRSPADRPAPAFRLRGS
jgi:hypothetical protein